MLGKVAKEGRSASQDSQAWRQVRARFVPEGQAVCDDLTMQCNATRIADGNIDVHEMIICSHQQKHDVSLQKVYARPRHKKKTLGARGILDCTTVLPL